jgi:hypothetical protein
MSPKTRRIRPACASSQPAAASPLAELLDRVIELLAQRLAGQLADSLADEQRKVSTVSVEPDFYTEREAARRSTISVRTLQGWRSKGRGPRFVRTHRKVLYPRLEFEEFMKGSSTRGAN